MKIPAAALNNVLSARGLDIATLASRSSVAPQSVERAIQGAGELDDDEITSIARELAVPVQALFAHTKLPLFPAIDFRTAEPRIGKFSRGTLEAINFVEQLSTTLAALNLDVDFSSPTSPYKPDSYSAKEAATLAGEWRERWGISDENQLEWQDANKIYTSLRGFIESLGILVLHRQFKTDEAAGFYAHVDDGPHVIVINTTGSSKARKLFTLAHEFGHVLLRAEGASNPSVLNNRVERFCNRFAACLLAPKRLINAALMRFGYIPVADGDWIRRFAKKIGLSQEATYLRLVNAGYLEMSDYLGWKSKFTNSYQVPLGDQSDGDGGGNGDPLRNKQTQYGLALLNLLKSARRSGKLDEIDIYRLVGLKPKFQDRLFPVI